MIKCRGIEDAKGDGVLGKIPHKRSTGGIRRWVRSCVILLVKLTVSLVDSGVLRNSCRIEDEASERSDATPPPTPTTFMSRCFMGEVKKVTRK